MSKHSQGETPEGERQGVNSPSSAVIPSGCAVTPANSALTPRSSAEPPRRADALPLACTQTSQEVSSLESDTQQLLAVIQSHGLHVPDDQAVRLAQYCRLLWDWNSRLNLTRHTDWELFVTRDLLDTQKLAEHIPERAKVLDVGSGGGVPGIALAVLRPDLSVALCESIGKKAAALQAIVKEMKLSVPVYADRAEVILKKHRFQVVTARAVAPISRMIGWFGPVWGAVGQLLLIKGRRWTAEYEEAQAEGLFKRLTLENLSSWATPGRDGESVLLRISNSK